MLHLIVVRPLYRFAVPLLTGGLIGAGAVAAAAAFSESDAKRELQSAREREIADLKARLAALEAQK